MLYRYGSLPVAPVLGDEVIINEPAIALSRGQGLVAPAFQNSAFGLDKLYAHFPPIYIFAESLSFRAFGVSVYSLRYVTTLMGIVSAGVFLLLMWSLCRWGLADLPTALLASCLYVMNTAVIALHRFARMESTVEFFVLSSLYCALAGIFSVHGSDEPAHLPLKNKLLLFASSVLAGVSLVTHPEAITVVLPIALLFLVAAPVSWRERLGLLALLGATPIVIWFITYGSKWKAAFDEMYFIHQKTAPAAGILSFGEGFSLETHRNIGQGMRATLFALCILVLISIVARWIALRSISGIPTRALAARRLRLTGIFALSTLLSLIPLIWFIAASITRYQVILPVYLAGLVISLQGVSLERPRTRLLYLFAGLFVTAQLAAMTIYLRKDNNPHLHLSANRFDAIVDSIPPQSRVAAAPLLWLAFQHKQRPFTLVYKPFDGREEWMKMANPLDQFDVILLEPSTAEYSDYVPYASQGRRRKTYVIGDHTVEVYQR